ncbi:MAG: hypothetical protein CMM26_14390 [Rhodospirillaceae bacterium]|nr:hypothetical protein [Rhodospirillaceae bacterium]
MLPAGDQGTGYGKDGDSNMVDDGEQLEIIEQVGTYGGSSGYLDGKAYSLHKVSLWDHAV